MLIALLAVVFTSFAQDQSKPLQSPRASSKGNHMSVDYGQPSVRGRVIFGDHEPYGKVWRTGANEATEVTFDKDCMVGGKPVKAGTYTLFTIPEKNEWTIILNSQLKQWGAFKYDNYKDKDVLNIKVPVKPLPQVQEKLIIQPRPEGLYIAWEKVSVLVPVKF